MYIIVHVLYMYMYMYTTHIHPPSPQNPQTAIPKGTFLAIAITTFVYVLMAIMVGMIFLRDAPGEFFFSGLETNATNCSNDTLISLNIFPPVNSCSSVYDFAANFPDCNCTLQQCSEDLPFCVDGSGVLPTEECILGDKSPSVLEEICGSVFLGLVNRSSCDFGLLNHLQVSYMYPVYQGRDAFALERFSLLS